MAVYFLRRTRAAIGVQLMRRAVAMLSACVPHDEHAESFLVEGQSDEAPVLPRFREVVLIDGAAECCRSRSCGAASAVGGEGRATHAV